MLLAQDVMKSTAALLNDQGLSNNGVPSLFTYTAQMPYLNIALGELRESLELNNVQVTNVTTTNLLVLIGDIQLTLAQLPKDLIEIQHLWERTSGMTNEDFADMTRVEYLPPYVVKTTSLIYWQWAGQNINFIGATSDRQLRMDYISSVLPRVIDPTDSISLINAETFLLYRNAALCAEFIGENKTRADSLNNDAQMAYDRFIGINTKGKQAIATRRRPFMAGWRSGYTSGR